VDLFIVNGLYDELMRLHRMVSKCKKTEERERERERMGTYCIKPTWRIKMVSPIDGKKN